MVDQGMIAGAIIKDNYQLTRKIGSGGMGEVWEARNPRVPQMRSAIKFLFGYTQGTEQFKRFQREAMILRSLIHPHITQLRDFDLDFVPPFIVLEYLEGEPLSDRIKRAANEGDRGLPIPEVVNIVSQVGQALEATHAQGIIHRDLKPENIYLCQHEHSSFPHVKVLDFGVSKVSGDQQITLHQQGFLGTPHYMSPEQALGHDDVDHRADQFALAIILYEMITGELPFKGEQIVQVATQIVHGDPAYVRELRPDFPEQAAQVLHRAFCKSPDDRFPDCQTFIEQLLQGVISSSEDDDWSLESKTEVGIRASIVNGLSIKDQFTDQDTSFSLSEPQHEDLNAPPTLQMNYSAEDFQRDYEEPPSSQRVNADPRSFPAYEAPYNINYAEDVSSEKNRLSLMLGGGVLTLLLLIWLLSGGEDLSLSAQAASLNQREPRPAASVRAAGSDLIEEMSLVSGQINEKRIRTRDSLPARRFKVKPSEVVFLVKLKLALSDASEVEVHWYYEEELQSTTSLSPLSSSKAPIPNVSRSDLNISRNQRGRWVILVSKKDELLASYPFEVN